MEDKLDNGLPMSEVNHNHSPTVDVKQPPGTTTVDSEYPLLIPCSEKTAVADAEAGEGEDGRETWGKKIDFLLSIIGFAVDLANVWRFPYLCYKNGGGAFLIPYFLMLFFGAVPLFFMELVLGQFHREGAITVWKIAPIFKGIGIAECLIAFYVAFYYNVIIAWAVYYLFASFTKVLPWTSCEHSWNTEDCFIANENANYSVRPNGSISAAAEYYERGVLGLHLSNGLDRIGPPRWQLFLCLVCVFIMLYFSLWKGVKSSGKVVWVTATMPYLVLSVLFVRGLTLPGSVDGIMYFITPKLDRLGDPQVWIDAAIQIFYSVGAGFGVHISYASYNKFTNNCYRDCLFTVCINSFTSIFSGFVIFSFLGYMALKQETSIQNVATEGPGLVFVVYPEAIATLPGAPAWSIVFFIMLLTLGLDSAMGGLEAVLTGLRDEFRSVIRKFKYGREAITAAVVLTAMLCALQNITNGGMYLFVIWDSFAAGTSILFAVFSQAVAISWIYGLGQFNADIEKMLGFKPHLYWRICWKFISPLFIFIIIISSIVTYAPLAYTTFTEGTYIYPTWANVFGWMIALSSMIIIPITAIYQLCKVPGPWKQKLAICMSPTWEHRAIIQGQKVKRFQLDHWTSI